MSQHVNHEVRRRYQETRRMQFHRLIEILDGGIRLNKNAVIIPACDFPLLFELLQSNEARLVEEERRTAALEIIDMFVERYSK